MRIARTAAVTDTGKRRRRNEDAYVCQPPLFAVADGMGGAQAGEVASRLAAAVLEEDAAGGETGEARVAELIQEANRRVYRRSSEDPAASGMGTTMTVALVDADAGAVTIGHVGDSRAYRIREGQVEQLTEDHSLVAELMRSGKLSPEEAEVHPQRSVITRALGTDPDVDVDAFTVDAQAGDVFLVCSDGLSSMVGDEEIARVLGDPGGDLKAAAKALVGAANRSGGEDNITVVVFELAEGDDSVDETRRMPAAGAGATEQDEDEDTLSGLEAVPAVDTMVVPVEEVRRQLEDADRPVSRPARAPNRVLPLVVLLLALAVIVVLVAWGIAR